MKLCNLLSCIRILRNLCFCGKRRMTCALVRFRIPWYSDIALFDPEHNELNMTLKQSIDWKNEWFPIEDATYLNFAAHAAIPRVALNAVQVSVAAKSRPHIVDNQSFFSVARSLRQSVD